MTNEQDRTQLDAVIDDVVRDMMQAEARSDLAGRVLRSIEEAPRRGWLFGAPAFAAAAVAVIAVLATAMMFTPGDEAVAVPSIQVVAGVPGSLETVAPASLAAELPRPAAAPAAAPAATSESIFGARRGQVGAASLRALPQVRLALVLAEVDPEATPRTQTLTIVLSNGQRREGHAGAAGEPQLSVAAIPEVLPSGAIKLAVTVAAPVRRQLTVTLVPGASTQLLDAVDPVSGRRTTIDATATLVKLDRPQR